MNSAGDAPRTSDESAGRPVLFLDVDGTISPLADVVEDAFGDMIDITGPFPEVLTSPTLLRRIGALDVDIVWVTDWSDPGSTFTPAMFGRTAPFETIPRTPTDAWWKGPAVREWLIAHPQVRSIVWCDDHLGAHDEARGRTRASVIHDALTLRDIQHLLVAPQKSTGITPDQMDTITRFTEGPPR